MRKMSHKIESAFNIFRTLFQETNSDGQQGSPMSVMPMSHATIYDEKSSIDDNVPSDQPIDDDETVDYEVKYNKLSRDRCTLIS